MMQALTGTLHAAGLRWALFVATRQLHNSFDRLRVATMDLGEARGDPSDWGDYYAAQPRLMPGDITAGHAFLCHDAVPHPAGTPAVRAGLAGAP
jgi:hypothetical protein